MVQEIPKKTYRKIHDSVPIACIDVAIINKKKVLLCKRTNKPAQGQFWFPGGRIYKGETLNEAVLRKTLQETGLNILRCEKMGAEETIFEDGPFGSATHTINVLYRATTKSDQVQNDSQHNEYIWADLKTRGLHPYVRKYIKIALE